MVRSERESGVALIFALVALAIVAFMVVGWVADKWASSDTSPTMQYLGLGIYIVAEAIKVCKKPALIDSTTAAEDKLEDAGIPWTPGRKVPTLK